MKNNKNQREKDKKEIVKEFGYFIIDGKYYETAPDKLDGKAVLIRVSDKIIKARKKKLQELTTALKEKLDQEAVMMEALSKLDKYALEQLHHIVFNSKRKSKVKTRKGY